MCAASLDDATKAKAVEKVAEGFADSSASYRELAGISKTVYTLMGKMRAAKRLSSEDRMSSNGPVGFR